MKVIDEMQMNGNTEHRPYYKLINDLGKSVDIEELENELLEIIKETKVENISIRFLLLLLPNVAKKLKRELVNHRVPVEGPRNNPSAKKEVNQAGQILQGSNIRNGSNLIRAASPQIDILLNGYRTSALIDTGSEVTTISKNLATRIGIKTRGKPWELDNPYRESN